MPNNTCKLHTEWKKTNLLYVGSDLDAGVGEGAVAGPAGGGAVGGVAQLPAQAAVHVAHLLNHSHSVSDHSYPQLIIPIAHKIQLHPPYYLFN